MAIMGFICKVIMCFIVVEEYKLGFSAGFLLGG
jgi:hypothetical protein